MEGILHAYRTKPALNIFEYVPRHLGRPSTQLPTPPNILLFVGGLFDNFSSPSYLRNLAELFPRHDGQQWALMHVQLSSAMLGFGTSDIDRDIEETGLAISHIRDVIRKGEPTNVVLLGQSTGCQITLHYISAPQSAKALRPVVQGAVLQAPMSDRDALMALKVTKDPERKAYFEKCMQLIATIPDEEYSTYMLPLTWTKPLFGQAPLCILRFLDLASPSSPDSPRKEDLFSHDLPQSRIDDTFGQIGARKVLGHSEAKQPSILILISESDEIISQPLTAQDMLGRWREGLSSDSASPVDLHCLSECVENATHDMSGDSMGQRRAMLVSFRGALLQYLAEIVGGVDSLAREVYNEGERTIARNSWP